MAAQSMPVPPTNQGGKTPRWTQPVSFYGQSVFSKYYAHTICAFLMLVPFLVMPAAAQAGQGTIAAPGCVTNYNASQDYFPVKIQVDTATFFSVKYFNNYKVVKNTDPLVNTTYVLTQCGTPAPAASGFSNTTVFFDIPVTNVAALDTTAVSYLEMLGERVAIKEVDTEGLVSSPCVQLGLEQNEIIGLDDNNATLLAQQLEAVDLIFSSYASTPANKTVITSEVEDPGPLNRAEWLEFYATFFNLEEMAQNLTGSINDNYNCFKKAASAATTKPLVAWTTYNAPSTYNNNTASWTISDAAYKVDFTVDAGGTFFNGTGGVLSFNTSAAFLAAIQDIDIMIDETEEGTTIQDVYTSYGLSASSSLKIVQNKAIFREDGLVNPNDGRDWFAAAVVMDDAVLQDMILAIHPELLPAGTPYNWIRNVAKGQPEQLLSSANCTATNSSMPVPDRAISCLNMKVGGSGSGAATKTVAGAMTAVLGLLAIAFSL
ncbi:hypothetical protein EMPS_00639 [Entomortierella parvispora]|uniref:Fe/B12 periplasmic-binding domain-containing protein n=1 Tax=Entomortierella parvispora TaxID=205924 RepID=A0A9P3H225_9FUNG|nr:hypothetical protein EMPS_00639 [Entomortierella parvispora]